MRRHGRTRGGAALLYHHLAEGGVVPHAGAAGPSPPVQGPLLHELPQAVPPDGLPVAGS